MARELFRIALVGIEPLEGGIERPSELMPIFLERLSLVYLRLGRAQQATAYRERYLTAADPGVAELQQPSDQGILFNMSLPPLENTYRSIPQDQQPRVTPPATPRG